MLAFFIIIALTVTVMVLIPNMLIAAIAGGFVFVIGIAFLLANTRTLSKSKPYDPNKTTRTLINIAALKYIFGKK
jgi:hypothetical protein